MTTAPHQQALAPVTAPTDDELHLLDAYWRTANYLAVCMIYLQDNPLLREPLRPEHIKPSAGPLGIQPRSGLHLDPCQPVDQQVRPGHDLHVGAGHGAPGARGPVYIDGSYTSAIQTSPWMRTGCASFSRCFPSRDIGSHCTAEMPGSIHEGGELGTCCPMLWLRSRQS